MAKPSLAKELEDTDRDTLDRLWNTAESFTEKPILSYRLMGLALKEAIQDELARRHHWPARFRKPCIS